MKGTYSGTVPFLAIITYQRIYTRTRDPDYVLVAVLLFSKLMSSRWRLYPVNIDILRKLTTELRLSVDWLDDSGDKINRRQDK